MLYEYVHMYTNYLKNRNRSENTIEQYEIEIRNFLDFIEQKNIGNIEEIKTIHIDLYQTYLIDDRKNKSATMQKKSSTIKQFFKYLHSRQYIQNNPCEAVDTIKIKDADRKKKRTLTPEQSIKLIEKTVKNSVLKERNKAILLIFLFCGLRVSELCGLKVRDVDFKTKTIYVNDGKGGKNREVPLNDEMTSDLKAYIQMRPIDSEYFFTKKHSNEPMNPRSVLALIKDHSEKANISGIGCHSLRRTAATHLLASDVPLNSIRIYLGHSSVNTTMLYLDPDKEEVKEQIRSNNVLSKMMKKKKNKKSKKETDA